MSSLQQLVPLQGMLTRGAPAGAFRLTETAYRGPLVLPRHAHRHPYVCFVVRGEFVEQRASRAVACPSLTVLGRPAGDEHGDEFAAGEVRCFNVELLERDDELGRGGPSVDARGGGASWAAARLFKAFGRAASVDEGELEALALELFAATRGLAGPAPTARGAGWLKRVVERLEDEPGERVSMRSLGELAGVHPMHVARVFRATLGESVGAYARRVRVERATQALVRSTAPIAEIALATGFADQAHFGRVFRDHTGITPSRFRALLGAP